jgi:hypothetical protein
MAKWCDGDYQPAPKNFPRVKFGHTSMGSSDGERAPMTRTVQGSKRWWRGCVVLWALGLLLTASLVVAAPGAKLATSSTTVSITFDDALAEQNAAADILHGRGLNGTFYIISSAVGTRCRSGISPHCRRMKLAERSVQTGQHSLGGVLG